MDDDVVQIDFPNSTDWVKVKRYLTEEDDAAATDYAMREGMKVLGRSERRRLQKKGDQQTYTQYFKSGAYRVVLLQRMIKAWSFTSPLTPETIARLPTFTRDYIFDKIDELNPSFDSGGDDDDDDGDGDGNGNGGEGEGDGNPLGPHIAAI